MLRSLNIDAIPSGSNHDSRHVFTPGRQRATDYGKLGASSGTAHKVKRGETIYRPGDPFRNLYVIRAGSFKSMFVYRDGRWRITGFQIAGEFLGMDGMGTNTHATEAVALEDSLIGVIPFDELEARCDADKIFQRHFHKVMSREIARESILLMLMGVLTAEERVATFLINLSQRFQDRGYSPVEFSLRMTREDIGSHLGLRLETISRMFAKLQQRKLIVMHGRQVTILDMEGLRQIGLLSDRHATAVKDVGWIDRRQ